MVRSNHVKARMALRNQSYSTRTGIMAVEAYKSKALRNKIIKAVREGKSNELEDLLKDDKNGWANDKDSESGLPLIVLATKSNHEECVQVLLKYRARVDSVCPEGRTSLMWACYRGFYTIASMLLEAKADPNKRDAHHETPFTLAAKGLWTERHCDFCLDMLMEQRAVIANRARFLEIALAMSSIASHTKSPQVLSRMLKDPYYREHFTTSHQETALGQAALRGSTIHMHLLIDHGVSVNALVNGGIHVLNMAVLGNVVDQLIRLGSVPQLSKPFIKSTLLQSTFPDTANLGFCEFKVSVTDMALLYGNYTLAKSLFEVYGIGTTYHSLDVYDSRNALSPEKKIFLTDVRKSAESSKKWLEVIEDYVAGPPRLYELSMYSISRALGAKHRAEKMSKLGLPNWVVNDMRGRFTKIDNYE